MNQYNSCCFGIDFSIQQMNYSIFVHSNSFSYFLPNQAMPLVEPLSFRLSNQFAEKSFVEFVNGLQANS